LALESEVVVKMNQMKALATGRQKAIPDPLQGNHRSPYLVNMIKSLEDPTQERYIMLGLL
jgi:hypothetical protein